MVFLENLGIRKTDTSAILEKSIDLVRERMNVRVTYIENFLDLNDESMYTVQVEFDEVEVWRLIEKHDYIPAFYHAGTDRLPGRMLFMGAGFEDPLTITLFPETIAALQIQSSDEAIQWVQQRLENYLAS